MKAYNVTIRATVVKTLRVEAECEGSEFELTDETQTNKQETEQ